MKPGASATIQFGFKVLPNEYRPSHRTALPWAARSLTFATIQAPRNRVRRLKIRLSCLSSHSQTTKTFHPSPFNFSLAAASRAQLREIVSCLRRITAATKDDPAGCQFGCHCRSSGCN
jgi:hypothetical protein